MDLDALGLNSTFESTELEHSHQPPVDRVDTSEIEGPEDFTMNMTYWMTADLPLAQIKSRKEANTKRPTARMDAIPDGSEGRQATEVGEPVVVVEKPRQRSDEPPRTASPSRRANGSSEERRHSKAVSERSMENDEKVRSFFPASTLRSKVDMIVRVSRMFWFFLHLSQSNDHVLNSGALFAVFDAYTATRPSSLIFMHMYTGSGELDQKGPPRVPRGAESKRAGNKREPFLNPGRA